MKLSSFQNTQDSIRTRCFLDNGDVNIATDTLDKIAENKLDVFEFDSITMQLKARFKASFTDESQPP